MDTKLKRAKALATGTSTLGRAEAGKSRRTVSRSDPERISFSLADILNTRVSVVSKGVVIRPPRPPSLVVEVTFEVPVETPDC